MPIKRPAALPKPHMKYNSHLIFLKKGDKMTVVDEFGRRYEWNGARFTLAKPLKISLHDIDKETFGENFEGGDEHAG